MSSDTVAVSCSSSIPSEPVSSVEIAVFRALFQRLATKPFDEEVRVALREVAEFVASDIEQRDERIAQFLALPAPERETILKLFGLFQQLTEISQEALEPARAVFETLSYSTKCWVEHLPYRIPGTQFLLYHLLTTAWCRNYIVPNSIESLHRMAKFYLADFSGRVVEGDG